MEVKSLKSITKLLNRICVGQQGLDLSKEILWVSVSQRAAELPAGKVGSLKKILPCSLARASWSRTQPHGSIFFQTSNFVGW